MASHAEVSEEHYSCTCTSFAEKLEPSSEGCTKRAIASVNRKQVMSHKVLALTLVLTLIASATLYNLLAVPPVAIASMTSSVAPTPTFLPPICTPVSRSPTDPPADKLPSSVDFGADMPEVRSQGNQGSCAAWAVAYYYKSFQERRERGWNYSEDTEFSPSYIFSQFSNPNSKSDGIRLEDAFRVLVEQGVAPLSSFPYNENDWTTTPSPDLRAKAAPYKAASCQRIQESSGFGFVDALREHLAEGDPVAIGLRLYVPEVRIVGWQIWVAEKMPTVIDVPSASYLQMQDYVHALTLVGYDDERQRFKFVNSWGTKWGEMGYGYITYRYIIEMPDIVAYFMTDIIAPRYNARLTQQPVIHVLQPNERTSIVIGLQNTSNTPWLPDNQIQVVSVGPDKLGLGLPKQFLQPIPIGSTMVFTLTGTAPKQTGVYASILQMSSKDGPFGERMPISVIVVPKGNQATISEMIQAVIEEARRKLEEALNQKWQDFVRQIIASLEGEARREAERFFRMLCGTAPAGVLFATGLVWWRRRRQ